MEEAGERVFVFFRAVCGADSGGEGRAGVAEAVGAGGFEGAIEFAQRPAAGGYGLGPPGVEDGPSDHRDDDGPERGGAT